jgi:hypothetical protein
MPEIAKPDTGVPAGLRVDEQTDAANQHENDVGEKREEAEHGAHTVARVRHLAARIGGKIAIGQPYTGETDCADSSEVTPAQGFCCAAVREAISIEPNHTHRKQNYKKQHHQEQPQRHVVKAHARNDEQPPNAAHAGRFHAIHDTIARLQSLQHLAISWKRTSGAGCRRHANETQLWSPTTTTKRTPKRFPRATQEETSLIDWKSFRTNSPVNLSLLR